MKVSLLQAAAAAAALTISHANAQSTKGSYNGLAVTPAMGWDNWNAYACAVSEELLLSTGQKMVDYGLRDLGYKYVILDDCWSTGRSVNGTLLPNMTKFPNGMKYVGDQLHSMGLKFGMYSSAGVKTCAQYPGSLGYETSDAKTFASWGVDYLKYDNCYNQGQAGTPLYSFLRYDTMSQALNQTGRPILYSLCNWGEDGPWNWATTISNSWRMSGDVYDSFSRPDARCPCTGDEQSAYCALPGFHCSVLNILNKMAAIAPKSQSGAFNDMDMLEVGNGGMSDAEYVLHFSMWAMNASPLIMGTSVNAMTAQSLSIYSNAAVIAVNQDPSASAAIRVWRYAVNDTDQYGQGEISLWVRQMASGDMIVALVNAGADARPMNATLYDIFLDASTSGSSGPAPQLMQTFDVYDLWGYRMDNMTAQSIINSTATVNGTVSEMGNSTEVSGNSTSPGMPRMMMSNMRYNATSMSYADGLAANNTALLGMKMSTALQPMGTLAAMVQGHSVGLYRLRSQGVPSSMRKRDEL